jgi:hypothetical protein
VLAARSYGSGRAAQRIGVAKSRVAGDGRVLSSAETRADRAKGFFVSFDYSRDALAEIDAYFRKSGRVIIPLTVREILDEHPQTGVAGSWSHYPEESA